MLNNHLTHQNHQIRMKHKNQQGDHNSRAWMECKALMSSGLSRIKNTVKEQRNQQHSNPPRTQAEWSRQGGASRSVWRGSYAEGFTIIELLIATSVFGLLLMIALAGFTGVGGLFYKGVAVTQTQTLTSQVISDVSNNIQAAASVSGPVTGSGGYTYYCVGGNRYTFTLKHSLDPSLNQNLSAGASGNFALIKDTLPGPTGCAEPCVTGCQAPFKNPQEMLGAKMRLMRFDIVATGGQFYNVYVTVAYGDDDSFTNVDDPDNITCDGGLNNQRFCAVDRLSGSVYEGLHS